MAHPGRELPDKAFGAFNPVIAEEHETSGPLARGGARTTSSVAYLFT